LQFFQDWTQRNSEVIAARSEFSLGIGAFNATINDDPDSRFFAYGAGCLLAPDTAVNPWRCATGGQSALPIEQFGLGGLESVRGYRQDLLY